MHKKQRYYCVHCSPKMQAELKSIMEHSASYPVNRNAALSFIDDFEGEYAFAYVFFAGYGRYDVERKLNMEKLEELVKGNGQRMEDYEVHELTVYFIKDLPQGCSFPPVYDKAQGERYSDALGPCARTYGLMLEKELVNLIDCNNKTGGGAGRPPVDKKGCSVAATSVIILVPRTQ